MAGRFNTADFAHGDERSLGLDNQPDDLPHQPAIFSEARSLDPLQQVFQPVG
jgi:hypothetical protein